MKKIFLLFLLVSSNIYAEGYMCNHYYDAVTRKFDNIVRSGSNLSQVAKQKTLDDLVFEIKQCVSNCEAYKFDTCNDIANKIEKRQY